MRLLGSFPQRAAWEVLGWEEKALLTQPKDLLMGGSRYSEKKETLSSKQKKISSLTIIFLSFHDIVFHALTFWN